MILAIITVVTVVAALVFIWTYRRLSHRHIVCYRCGLILSRVFPYMGLNYCLMCRNVVVAMAWIIPMGGPFGFPGSSGYLEYEDVPLDQRERTGSKEEVKNG